MRNVVVTDWQKKERNKTTMIEATTMTMRKQENSDESNRWGNAMKAMILLEYNKEKIQS